MKASRRTQPYRRGPRNPGAVLDAMLKGGPAYLPNPADKRRALQRILRQIRRG